MRYKYSPEPVCPHCGYEEIDAWELNFGPGLEGECVTWCDDCGEQYHIERYVSVTYSTKKVDDGWVR